MIRSPAIALACACVFGLGLTGCSDAPPVHGKIMAKQYIPSYTTWYWAWIGKSMMYLPDQHDECWQLAVQDHGALRDTCVSHAQYIAAQVGGTW